MRLRRNPFYMRFAEQIDSDLVFLQLFSPEVIDVLPADHIWDRTNILRSAPGGGKTSLLRVFAPGSLVALTLSRSDDRYKELFVRLRSLGAVDDQGPRVLGVRLSCTLNYSSLEDLGVDKARKGRLFLALLNARVVLSALGSAATLCRLTYPDDLGRLSLACAPEAPLPPGIPRRGSGSDYYNWACGVENSICEAIDNLGPLSEMALPGHDTLLSLWLLQSDSFLCDGKPVADRVFVMLDDIHDLSANQRKMLHSLILALRAPTQVWMAERLEALDQSEVLSVGASEGRDYNLVYLESHWRDHPKRFEAFARAVADRRADTASDGFISSFPGCLAPTFDAPQAIAQAITTVRERVHARAGSFERYGGWIGLREREDGSPYEKLLGWRSLEILIERDLRQAQQSLGFELSDGDLQSREQSDVRAAAELFLHQEFGFPYFYGFPRLCGLAASNIEQFLNLAGELFELSISASVVSASRSGSGLAAEQQERVLRDAVGQKWRDLTRKVPESTAVITFLESVGAFCRSETARPSAPYSPGVTGVAVRMTDRDRILHAMSAGEPEQYVRLGRLLASCIAHNLLEPELNSKCKGGLWMILYLNRMLCLRFDLPLQYGGWRDKPIHELWQWSERIYVAPRNSGRML